MGATVSVVAVETHVELSEPGQGNSEGRPPTCIIRRVTQLQPRYSSDDPFEIGFRRTAGLSINDYSCTVGRGNATAMICIGGPGPAGLDERRAGSSRSYLGGGRSLRSSILSRPAGEGSSGPLARLDDTPTAPVERILVLAEALFRMLDEMEGHISQQNQRDRARPAPEAVVEALPTRKWVSPASSSRGKEKEGEGPQCYICLSEYADGDTLRCLPCKHEYHASCVDKWLKEVHQVCPLCRSCVGDDPNAECKEEHDGSVLAD